jgi:histidinol-phosphate aminotransferase/threonine-phosphate decarboxylase
VAAALPELLAAVDLMGWTNAIADLRDRLVAVLNAAGYETDAGAANWVLVHAPGLRTRLARHAICTRDCTSFGLPGTIRIAVPDAAGLDRLAAAL